MVSPLGLADRTLPPERAMLEAASAAAQPSSWVGQRWRIDSAHSSRSGPAAASSESTAPVAVPEEQKVRPLDSRVLAVAHAENLIHRVQQMSEDLDARSAKLNADIAAQERRERAFRLWAQQRSEELVQQQAACEAERRSLQQQARRLAFGGD